MLRLLSNYLFASKLMQTYIFRGARKDVVYSSGKMVGANFSNFFSTVICDVTMTLWQLSSYLRFWYGFGNKCHILILLTQNVSWLPTALQTQECLLLHFRWDQMLWQCVVKGVLHGRCGFLKFHYSGIKPCSHRQVSPSRYIAVSTAIALNILAFLIFVFMK